MSEKNSGTENKLLPPHHIQQELCTTRPLYRQGRKLTAIKVYTINNESQHLVMYRVPKINLQNELQHECLKFGDLKKFEVLNNYKTDIFTECFHAHFERIQSSRIAKRFLDNKSFYGEILHVCYAPEFETLTETENKLLQRQKDVLSRLEPGPTTLEYLNMQPESCQQNRKRKNPALPITEKRLKTGENQLIWEGVPTELDPRIENTNDSKVGFKKHFQIINSRPRGIEYGPQLPSDINNSFLNVTDSDLIKTTLLPTSLIKKYEHNCNKRIVFRNNK